VVIHVLLKGCEKMNINVKYYSIIVQGAQHPIGTKASSQADVDNNCGFRHASMKLGRIIEDYSKSIF